MVAKERLKMAINSLNNAVYHDKDGKSKELVDTKVILGNDENVIIENFMTTCENIPIELEEKIPDLVADVYNDLKDQLDAAGKLALPQSNTKVVSKKSTKEKLSNNREGLPRFGLRQGSMAYAIVVALETGITKEHMVKQLMKDFGRTSKAAENKFIGDMKSLKKYGAKISIENGIYKLGGRE